MNLLHDFHGPNAGYILELYERYQQDPNSVDPETRAYFKEWTPTTNGAPAITAAAAPAVNTDKLVGAVNLAQAVREYGHLAAQLDPLGTPPPGDSALDEAYYDLTEDNLRQLPASLIGGPVAEDSDNALQAINQLRQIYSSTIGYDYDHMRQFEERSWLRQAAETSRFRPSPEQDNYGALLQQLTAVEVFERFLHRTFPGKTRFSIEGLDIMVPMLNEIIGRASHAKFRTILLGMAHRGRLNVLTHVQDKDYAEILAEFKDPVTSENAVAQYLATGWTGDVKYHKGVMHTLRAGEADPLVVSMTPNPSHLELVNPVVAGMARAAGTKVDHPGPAEFKPGLSLPILIHGDASFSGQGIVAETFNFRYLRGYDVGGTIHIIANNQLGFTAEPDDSRSTLYASDVAKGYKVPIVHVNADDPEACLEVARLAIGYLLEFGRDFVIDLIGYRRYGHNEGDEPRFTQPQMYKKVDEHPTVRELWANKLVEQNLITAEQAQEMVDSHFNKLQEIMNKLDPQESIVEPEPEPPPPGAAKKAHTAVPIDRLRGLHRSLLDLPEGFTLHPRLSRILKPRHSALDDLAESKVDWAMAEALALASILEDGIAIRMTGEDVERGTFSHRHAVLHDAETGQQYVPMQHLPQAGAAFEIVNSPLTENGAVGFEYGYNIQEPDRLVIWEAQYGDFINGAQPVIDEFIVSGRDKWGQTPSLVLLLPHGYEGAGPDHSTGRPERFLQMAADINIRIANCTTSAQYFHLLRRQAVLLKTDPLPLIILTPKSLLRNPLAASPPQDFVEGIWQPVIDDARAKESADKVKRLVLCSGKMYIDLISSEYRDRNEAVAVARIEQLYPLLPEAVLPVLEGYPNLAEVMWVQEEPRNMGAWEALRPQLRKLIDGRWPLSCTSRPRRASPAEGSSAWHAINQKELVRLAFDLE
ncbi:MAG: 2-oxoglutarate dehydrogenase E1 component [Anaerolineales bacterium]|nr:2-oxoglutarate dehydrogenase E1 component [Anaerolineales bacterium]